MPAELQSPLMYGYVEQHPDGSVNASTAFNKLHGYCRVNNQRANKTSKQQFSDQPYTPESREKQVEGWEGYGTVQSVETSF